MAKPPVPLGTYIGAGKVAAKNADVHYTVRLLEKKICWLDYKEEKPHQQKDSYHAEGAFVVDTAGAKPTVKFTVGGLPGQAHVGDVHEFTVEESPAGPPVLSIDGIFLQPQADTLSEEAKVCAQCGKKIEGQALGYGGCFYHKECFVCTKCNKSLAGKSFAKQEDGSKICQACQPQRYCEFCKKQITGQMMAVGDKVYHPACFKCEVCENPIDGSYFVKNEKIMCKGCLDASKSPTKTIRRTCRGCKRPIEGCIMVEGEKGDVFHEECLVCADCNCKLEKETYKYRDSKYRCSACDDKAPKDADKSSPPCAFCGKPCPPGDDHLRTMDGTILHWSCFTCSTCKTAQTVEQWKKTDPTSMKQLRTAVQNAKKGMFVCQACLTGCNSKEAAPTMPLGTYCGKKAGEGANGTDIAYALNLQKEMVCWLDCTTRTAISSSSWHSEGSFAEEVINGKIVRVRYTVGNKQSIGGGPEKGKIYLFDVDGEVLIVEGVRCSFQANASSVDVAEYMKPAPGPKAPAPVPTPEVKNASAPLPGEGLATKVMTGSKDVMERKEIDKGKTIGEAPPASKPAPAPAPTPASAVQAPPASKPAPAPAPTPASAPPAGCFTLEELQDVNVAKSNGVDPSRREEFLSDDKFLELFGTSKAEFAKLPKWKRDKQKKDHGLF